MGITGVVPRAAAEIVANYTIHQPHIVRTTTRRFGVVVVQDAVPNITSTQPQARRNAPAIGAFRRNHLKRRIAAYRTVDNRAVLDAYPRAIDNRCGVGAGVRGNDAGSPDWTVTLTFVQATLQDIVQFVSKQRYVPPPTVPRFDAMMQFLAT